MQVGDQPPDSAPEESPGSGTPGRTIRAQQLAPVAAASAATTIWLALLGLITTPYMLHTLGASAYAVFALVTIMAAYLSNLELGFGHATLRFLARAHAKGDPDAEARIVGTSLFVFGCAGVLAAVIAFAVAPTIVNSFADFPANLEDDAVGALRLASLVLLLTFLYSFAQVSLQALGRFRPLLWTRLVFGTLVSVSAVGAAAIFDDVRAVLAAHAAIALSSCVAVFIALGRSMSARIRPAFHRPTFREMAGYGALVLGTGLAYQVMMHGPPTVLAGSAPSAEVAAFAIPAVVLQQLLLLVNAASTGFMPFASAESTADDRGRLSAVFRSHLRLTIAVIGPIAGFLVVFADPLLRAWVGADFAAEAADPLRLLAVAGFVVALAAPAGDVVRGLGRPGWGLAHGIVAGGVGVLVAFVAVERSGATGAALGLLIGVSVVTPPFIVVVADRLLNQPPLRLAASVAVPVLAVLAAVGLYWAGSVVVSGFGGALIGVVITLVYALASFRLVLDDVERATLLAGRRTLAPIAGAVARFLPGLRRGRAGAGASDVPR